MKLILITTLFLTTQLFANYAFNNDKKVKIDMHGGNSEKLSNTKGFSNMKAGGLGGLSSFGIKKPKEPTKPKEETVPKLKDIKLK
jgi:hypothetical protein